MERGFSPKSAQNQICTVEKISSVDTKGKAPKDEDTEQWILTNTLQNQLSKVREQQ